MKKNLFYIAALCAAALVSCTPKELVIDEPNGGEEITDATALVHVTINASMDEATKAYIDDADGFAWKWAENDQLAVFDASNQKIVFTINSSTAGSSVAKFEADGVPSTFVPVKAVFPASAAGATPDEFNIKSAQSPSTYSIDPEAMVATADGEKVSDTEFNFYFEPAVSYFRFAVAAGVSKVILHTVGKDDTIAGDSRSVTVNLSGTEGKFWAAVNPAVYHGIRAFAYDGTSYTKKGADAAEIDLSAKGSGKNIGTVSGGTEVAVIENADALVSYLGGTPALDGYIVNDLDLTGKTITTCASFAKTFDGQYHSIKNWTSEGESLFGACNGTIQNLLIDKSCSITSTSDDTVGFLAESLTGKIENCSNGGNITLSLAEGNGVRCIGSLIGKMNGESQIVNCSNSGSISITTTLTDAIGGYQHIGGIVGLVDGECESAVTRLDSCSNSGTISVVVTGPSGKIKHHFIGGLAGSTTVNAGTSSNTSGFTKYYGDFRNCENNGAVTASWTGGTGGYFKLGGILGYCEGAIYDCTNKENGNVQYTNSGSQNAAPAVGGICGVIAGTASVNAKDCTNNGKVSLSGLFSNATNVYTYSTAGVMWATAGGCFGIVGDNTTLVENCDNYGEIYVRAQMSATAGSSSSFGGVIGYSKAEVKGCDNLSTKKTDLSGMSKSCFMAGCVGYAQKPVSECKVSAPMTMAYDITTLTTNQPSAISNIGGIVGYAEEGATMSDCENNSAYITATSNGEIRFGGIVGMSYVKVSGCTNHAEMSVSRTPVISKLEKTSYIGGVVGLQNANYAIEYCSNKKGLSATLDPDSKYSYVAGVVAYTKGSSVKGCSNEGVIDFDGGGMVKQMCVCGICGWNAVTISYEDLVNSGDITVDNWTNASYNYIAGIAGNYYVVPKGETGTSATDNTYIRCSNSGNITSTAKIKIRVGGIGAAINSKNNVSNCHNTGDISVTKGLAESQIGGIAGYWGKGNMEDCSSSGIVDGDADTVSLMGGMIGALNVNSTWTNFTSSGSVTANSGNSAGSLIGGFSSANKALTLSGTNTVSATVNGEAANSDNAVGNLNGGSINGY